MKDNVIDQEMFETLQGFFGETVLLFHRMTILADQIHGKGTGTTHITAGRRGILRELYSAGPRTIPQMARARPVTRQLIQNLVTSLIADGLAEYIPNPIHKRSHLVTLTEEGKKTVGSMTEKELEYLSGLRPAVSKEDLAQAMETMKEIRGLFEGSEWEQRLNIESGV